MHAIHPQFPLREATMIVLVLIGLVMMKVTVNSSTYCCNSLECPNLQVLLMPMQEHWSCHTSRNMLLEGLWEENSYAMFYGIFSEE